MLSAFAIQARADGFPESYVEKGLIEAKQGVSVDVGKLAAGELLAVEYAGRPVFVYRRTASDIAALEAAHERGLVDPRGKNLRASLLSEYGSSSSAVWARLLVLSQPIAQKFPFRSIDKELMVAAGWGPGSGCSLKFVNPIERTTPNVIFLDPCTGAQFDAAGRVSASSPTSWGVQSPSFNMAVPPYRVSQGDRLEIGPAEGQIIPELNFSRQELYRDDEPTKLLISAARYNDIETIRAALKKGAKADYFKRGEGSPIDAAVVGSSMEVIRLLVAHGAKQTPNTLNAASFVGRQEVIEYLNSVPK